MRHFQYFPLLCLFLSGGITFPTMAQKFNLLIGTYTRPPQGNPAPPPSEGIYVYEFDAASGSLTYRSKVTGLSNPSYLAVSADNQYVYAVNEGSDGGSITALRYRAADGGLTVLNRVSSGSAGPCYVSVDHSGKFVFAANYGGGSIIAIPVRADGSLDAKTQPIAFSGSGPDPQRQDRPHLHSVVLSPDNRFLFASDLGTDRVYAYRINPKQVSAPLVPAKPPFTETVSGSGPRHLIFNAAGTRAYLVQELSGAITVFSYASGVMKQRQYISMLPDAVDGKKFAAADIHLSPDEKFLYASNRIDVSEIVVFSVAKDGKLTFKQRVPSLGQDPRNFAIDPTGNYVLVANQRSNNVVVFKRDRTTGMMTDTGTRITLAQPVCLKFTAQ